MNISRNNKCLSGVGRAELARGFSLVELVVGMTAGAVVFCLSISTVERTMKLSKDASARAEHQLAMARLGRQLRSDVHGSNGFHSTTENSVITLEMTSELPATITYKFNGSTVTRESVQPGVTSTGRDTFRLADSCRVQLNGEPTETNRLEMAVMRQTPEGEMLESRLVARAARLFPLQTIKKGQ